MEKSSREVPAIRIRLKGLAGKHDNFSALKTLTGYQLTRDGDDYLVHDDDPKLREPRPTFLMLGRPLDIRHRSSAEKVITELGKAPGIPDHIAFQGGLGIIGDLGFYSRLDNAARPFFHTPLRQLEPVLHERVFPFMQERNALMMQSMVTDIRRFYSRVSIPKLTFLISQFGIDQAEAMIFSKRVFADVLPNVFEPQEIFDAFLIFPPYLAGWSLRRPDCALVFLSDALNIFDFRLFKTLPDHIVPDGHYLEENGVRATMEGIRSGAEVQDLISIFADATNEFWDFFTRPMLWLGADGILDELRLIKAMALGRLLVSDVAAIQRSSSSYARNRLMFSFFDKFSQLCVERAQIEKKIRNETESKWASYFMHDAMIDLTRRIFRHHYKFGRRRAFSSLADFAISVKESIGRDFSITHATAGVPVSSASEAEYVRLIRNLAHGSFLSKDKFEKQFLKANPRVPVDGQRLPWLYLLAFSISPEYFLDSAITILSRISSGS